VEIEVFFLFLVGVYSCGPIWGRIVDKRGPRIPLIGAFILLLLGYSGIKHFFDTGLPDNAQATKLSHFSFILLVLFSYMSGAGGNGGLTSSVNSTAKTFPDKAVRGFFIQTGREGC
jgi:MFS family permease